MHFKKCRKFFFFFVQNIEQSNPFLVHIVNSVVDTVKTEGLTVSTAHKFLICFFVTFYTIYKIKIFILIN